MDDRNIFDEIARTLARPIPRRHAFSQILRGLAGAALVAGWAPRARAQRNCPPNHTRCGTTCCPPGQKCCGTHCCPNSHTCCNGTCCNPSQICRDGRCVADPSPVRPG